MALREDLALAAFAVAHGFILRGHHGENVPHFDEETGVPKDSLNFETTHLASGDRISVFETARGWRVARLINGHYTAPKDADFHRRVLPALKAAIKLRKESPQEVPA